MQIDIRRPKVRSGELGVHVNGSGMRKGDEPYAEIIFAEDRTASLHVDSPADCDRLARAVADAKRKLEAAVVPHAFRESTDGDHWLCRECGVHEAHHIDAPEPSGEGGVLFPAPLCRSCEIEPATEGDFCDACAPAVLMAAGTLNASNVGAAAVSE